MVTDLSHLMVFAKQYNCMLTNTGARPFVGQRTAQAYVMLRSIAASGRRYAVGGRIVRVVPMR